MVKMFAFVLLFLFFNRIDSCPLTDPYLSRCHCGILTNGDSYIKCDENTLHEIPIFKRSFPYDELDLSKNNIRTLPSSSLDHIKTIRRINLADNALGLIDPDFLRLSGNYLEELILTGDNRINSLEFLTRYPLKNLRVLRLDQFDLSALNLESIFANMTRLEILSLRSCHLQDMPKLGNVQVLDLAKNQISKSIALSTSYIHLNLAENSIVSIVLENNSKLISLNLSKNNLNEFFVFAKSNDNLQNLDLSYNSLTFLDFSTFNDNLTNLNFNYNRLLSIYFDRLPRSLQILSLNNNLIKQMKFSNTSSLSSLDLSFNQIKTFEKNSLFEKLSYLNLQENPLQCNCHLQWLKTFVQSQTKFNASTWTCLSLQPFLSSDFQCSSLALPRIVTFNISYVKISSEPGLLIQWSIVDDSKLLDYIQISIAEPFYLSPKLPANQTEIVLGHSIQTNQQYHICLILGHRYARDKYCREFHTDKLVSLITKDIVLEKTTPQSNEINLFIMLLGSCIGGLVTCILLFTCCYLCCQIQKFQSTKKNEPTPDFSYPIYHPHSITCPYHHHENTSNSTDSSQLDSSLVKHIYQTIDQQDYSSFNRETQLFDLWNQSLRHKR